MLALPDTTRLTPRDRHALACLVDASGVLPAEGEATARAVRLVLDDAPASEHELLRAKGQVKLPWSVGEVRLPLAWLRIVADLVTAASDDGAPTDAHGRPVSGANRLVKAGVERWPVVSLLASGLRQATRLAAGDRPCFVVEAWPHGRTFAAALSHDLDVVEHWPVFTALRLRELQRRKDWRRINHVMGAAIGGLLRNPVWRGVEAVLTAEQRAEARSTWFIICGPKSLASMRAGDVTYRPDGAAVRRIVRTVREQGHEIGLHGSFETARDGERFVAQRSQLAGLADASVRGVRQHFLKRTVGATERAMDAAGFAFDSTGGFPDRNGFKLGLADVVPVWDASQDRALALEEVPFCWMDRAQSKYLGVEDPSRWIDDAFELADRCEAVQGVWCGIWHPNLTPALGFPDAHEAYERLVRGLVSRKAWLAPIGEVVRWRQGRRSLRVTAVQDGVPTIAAAEPPRGAAPLTFRILDRLGTACASVTA